MTPNNYKYLTPTSKPNYYVTRSGHVYYKDNDTYTLVKPHTLLAKGVNLKRLIYYAYNPDAPKDLWIRTIGELPLGQWHDYSLKNLRAVANEVSSVRPMEQSSEKPTHTSWRWRVWHWLVRLVG